MHTNCLINCPREGLKAIESPVGGGGGEGFDDGPLMKNTTCF